MEKIDSDVEVTEGTYYEKPVKDDNPEKIGIFPQYFCQRSHDVRVCHENGILCYDTASSSNPSGQFIAPKVLDKDNNKFSIEILKEGELKYVSIGLVPKDYPPSGAPGWYAHSIGYHADDGGVFVQEGNHAKWTVEECETGDTMGFYADREKKTGFFQKNGKTVKELKLTPGLGFYPCVGFGGHGEVVKLLEKEPWLAKNQMDESLMPPAFETHKYEDLWISPGSTLVIRKLRKTYYGWLILHNPSKQQVAFRFCIVADNVKTGVLEHEDQHVERIKVTDTDDLVKEVSIEWVALRRDRNYTEDDVKKMLDADMQQNYSTHRLKIQYEGPQNEHSVNKRVCRTFTEARQGHRSKKRAKHMKSTSGMTRSGRNLKKKKNNEKRQADQLIRGQMMCRPGQVFHQPGQKCYVATQTALDMDKHRLQHCFNYTEPATVPGII